MPSRERIVSQADGLPMYVLRSVCAPCNGYVAAHEDPLKQRSGSIIIQVQERFGFWRDLFVFLGLVSYSGRVGSKLS